MTFTLYGDVEVSLVLSGRVGHHTGVLALVRQRGLLQMEQVAVRTQTRVRSTVHQLGVTEREPERERERERETARERGRERERDGWVGGEGEKKRQRIESTNEVGSNTW